MTTPTMQTLYPNGAGYHDTHEPYIAALHHSIPATASGMPVRHQDRGQWCDDETEKTP
jgi:hypothetical protein